MKTSSKGISLITSFEGYRSKAYQCSAGVWTIGYGTTRYPNGKAVKSGDTCTKAQAKTYFANDLVKFETVVGKALKVQVTQNMFDAMVSHAYNCGNSNAIAYYLNKDDITNALKYCLKPNTAKGIVLAGLTRRRKAEQDLFKTNMFIVPSLSVTSKSSKLNVMWVQTKLNSKIKANLTVDGVYGENTKKAVLKYWKSLNWNKDGKSDGWTVGAKTIKMLAT